MVGEQLGEDVRAVEPQTAHPGQVVEPDLVDEHLLRLDAEQARRVALEVDRDVAQPDGAVALVEQGAGHDPDRVGEVDDPGAVGRPLAHALGDLEHHRHRPQGLPETARAGGLLTDAPARKWERLVGEPSCLTADPDLDQDEVGAVDRAVEVVGHRQPPVETLAGEHPLGHPAHHLAPLGVDVVEDELPDLDAVALAGEPGDELGGVGGAAADHCDLHPFTPVSVTPWTNAFWARKNRMITGSITSSVAAMTRFHWTWWSERNCDRPIDATQLSGLSER